MQENEFEKQIQQKMEELKIHPSDTVWQNIEANITEKKRRRIGWIFFPIFLVLLCGGYWLWNAGNFSTSNFHEKPLPFSAVKKDVNLQKHISEKSVAEKNTPSQMQSGEDSTKDVASVKQNKKIIAPAIIKKYYGESSALQAHNNKSSVFKSSRKNVQQDIAGKIKISTKNAGANVIENEISEPTDTQNLKRENKILFEEAGKTTAVKDSNSSLIKLSTDSIDRNKETKNVIVATSETVSQKPNELKGKWKWGLTFSSGISGTSNNFFGSSLDKSLAPSAQLSLLPPATSAPLPSKIKSSVAIIAGFFIEKNIPKNKMISIGLNYKLFSTTNKVGSNDSATVYRLDNAVNNYHNYYHFIELPVSLKIQLSAKKFPLFWDGGISISQLISSNALQHHSASIVYYNDNSIFNKTQVGFSTGLYTTLYSKQKTSILIGPYIYYGLSKIATDGLYKNLHFNVIGLRYQLLFKK